MEGATAQARCQRELVAYPIFFRDSEQAKHCCQITTIDPAIRGLLRLRLGLIRHAVVGLLQHRNIIGAITGRQRNRAFAQFRQLTLQRGAFDRTVKNLAVSALERGDPNYMFESAVILRKEGDKWILKEL